MRILILDGKENQALAASRSLAKKGFTITCADDTLLSKSFYSKSCSRHFVYKSPRLDINAFLEDIYEELNRHKYAAILPMTEKTIWPISISRDKFLKKTLLLIPPHEILINALDKRITIGVAEKLRIPIPKTWIIDDGKDIHIPFNEILYPVVIKPAKSENIIKNQVVAGGQPLYANNLCELRQAVRQFSQRSIDCIIQEFIPGTGQGIFSLFSENEPIVYFAHNRLRDIRPTGSGSSLRESTKPDNRLIGYSNKLLVAIKWQGVAMVEFRKDSRSGKPILMEVNGRFWNSLPLAIVSGVDFPHLLFKSFAGFPISAIHNYKNQVKCRWLIGDIRHFIEVMIGKPKNFTGQFPKRYSTIKAMLRDSIDRTIYYDVWSTKDPRPFLVEVLELILRALHR
jgi:predicted ATP-grasp superfamily ATP-dependent carboligase